MADNQASVPKQPLPGLARKMSEALAPWSVLFESLSKQITRGLITQHQEQFRAIFETSFTPLRESLLETVAPAFLNFRELWNQQMPENWKDMKIRDIEGVVRFMTESGVALAWVPRQDLVQEIVTSQDETACLTLLHARQSDVLTDLATTLGQVTHPDLFDLVEGAKRAMDAVEHGHHWAGQALAAATLTTIIHGPLDSQLGELRHRYESVEPFERHIREFRILSLVVTLARVTLARFKDEVPSRFNRHASLHKVSPTQYTQPNELVALLMVVAILRELQALSDRGEIVK